MPTIQSTRDALRACLLVTLGALALAGTAACVHRIDIQQAAGRPMVVDADALNLLAALPRRSDQWVITPHPGEAARLLKV